MLSKKLTKEFGKGFSETNLKQMKTFYINYEKSQTLSAQFKLSWSHYLILMRIENINARNFYEIEAFENNWSLRELKRQVNSSLYERLVLSKDKEKVKEILSKYDFDYLIVSIHFIKGWGFDFSALKHKFTDGDLVQIWKDYAKEIEDVANTGMYDILGHPFNLRLFKNIPEKNIIYFNLIFRSFPIIL